MKGFLLFFVLTLSTSSVFATQDSCKMIGAPNTMGMKMTVTGQITCTGTDKTKYTIMPMMTVPYTIEAIDTSWFHVCILAADGKKHTAQIKYMTNMGFMSYTVTIQAPSAAGVANPDINSTRNISLYPNPAKNFIRMQLNEPVTTLMSLTVVDEKGASMMTQSVSNDEDLLVSITNLSNGTYSAILKSENRFVGSQRFVILK